MSRIKLLLDVVEDLSELTADLKRLVDAMAGDEPREQTEAREPETVVTIEGVRAVLSRKAVQDVRGLLNEFGLKKLSEADPNDYRKLLEKAETLPDKEDA